MAQKKGSFIHTNTGYCQNVQIYIYLEVRYIICWLVSDMGMFLIVLFVCLIYEIVVINNVICCFILQVIVHILNEWNLLLLIIWSHHEYWLNIDYNAMCYMCVYFKRLYFGLVSWSFWTKKLHYTDEVFCKCIEFKKYDYIAMLSIYQICILFIEDFKIIPG